MKGLIKTLAFIIATITATVAQAGILDGKFGTGQMFDVQYYWSGNDLVASSFTRVFSSTGQLTVQDYTDMTANNRYFAFFNSTTHSGEYGLAIYNSDGTVNRTLHTNGTITALGNDAIFYLGSGFYGTVIPTTQGYAFGDSATFTAMNQSPTASDISNYNAGTTPLAAGQSANTPTPVYLSSITTAQTATKTAALATTTGNQAIITITGNDNDVDVNQLSNSNFVDLSITGDDNIVAITQVSSTLARHFAEIELIGDDNQFTLSQSDTAKTAFISSNGDLNVLNITQKDGGLHYLSLANLGDSAQITILQEGAGNHSATIDLENGGGNWVFELTQSGTTDYLYSLPHNLTDNSVVTGVCYSGTCNMTILQQ